MKLIIVRHGETHRNRDKHHPSQGPVGLNNTGRQQAEAVAQRLKDEKIDIIYASDMLRAQQTAEIIARFHFNTKLTTDQNLRERDSGIYAKQTVFEREAAQQASGIGFRDWRPEGGESLRDVKQRAIAWFKNLRSQSMGKTVLIVSHGFFLYSLLEVVIEDGADVEREEFSMSNAGMTMLEIYSEGRPNVIHINDTSHLGAIRSLPSAIKSAIKGSSSNNS